MSKRIINLIIAVATTLLLGSCGKPYDVQMHGVQDIKFVSLDKNKLRLNIVLDAENKQRAALKIKQIDFKAWLGDRELGTVRCTEKIKLKGKRRTACTVPLEIELRTIADALKLTVFNQKLLSQIQIEGHVRGSRFPITKTFKVNKQPLLELLKSARISAPST
ncbi:MAG: hypothetical protein IJU72_09300 [Bacteroidales bacterium]|nr:hypothetical protein [Bacteroidales bacterium]